ncbi:Ribosomal RNA large subunit methyltransferase K [Andreprevotia sp. IGB-42]|uniref:class I SAM-dependent methyltransferase n=1 Tax=Andreprevotia sp. IGB-42 TaxID=2497473 RepID=UPI00135A25A8|nr:class I SAM-dependent methyltransferase [Andreprevotia sp. IGB-42]KAF0811300.1 Ribosomal RNA large subunit methyltransferase K [Andreprevotia sp. IGB-42]
MANLQDYKNRLAKNAKHWAKWARRQNTQCYRVYDRDVPEFPVIVDWYNGRVHLQEVRTGWVQTEEDHEAWLAEIWFATGEVLGISEEQVALKIRNRQRGDAQYEKTGEEGEEFIVEEDDLKFIVNLDAYLDTGLFLDHRNTRRTVRAEAAGKRFLNLFCYTGAFTVHAAVGGARSSVSVDMSNTYLEWARRNLEINGLDTPNHERIRADVFQFFAQTGHQLEKFDLIVLDPPSFSNSKKMAGILDVQRDHRFLVESALELLNPGGVLYFSTNYRRFKLDEMLEPLCADISGQSVPEDFRNKRIHQCFRFVKG